MIDGELLRSYASAIAKGYIRIAKSAGTIVIALLAVAGISAALVTPLWYLATKHTGLYTIISIFVWKLTAPLNPGPFLKALLSKKLRKD